MAGILVISESKSSSEMLKTVSKVLDKKNIPGITDVIIRSDQSSRTLKSKINQAIKQVDDNNGILIFTELYGSTQSNVCLDFLQKGEIEMITGYNVPMLLKAATLCNEVDLKTLIEESMEAGKKYIKVYDKKND